jgi:hypothetical protein
LGIDQSALQHLFPLAVGPNPRRHWESDHGVGDEHERFGNSNIRTAFGLDAGRFVDGVSITATSV